MKKGRRTKKPNSVKLLFGIAMLGVLAWEAAHGAEEQELGFLAFVAPLQIMMAFCGPALGKVKWKKKPNLGGLVCGIGILGLSIWQIAYDVALGIVLIQAISALQEIVFAFYEEPQPAADPRPLKERYLEQMQKCSNEELQKILKDPLRGEEIKQVAENILKKRPIC